ncbi:MAG TPA: plastocyanin/azurin family copper-binding protein [Usitatibacter sp.]|nr:plastocyanin/azurin family copper-binding protein [Usitatibacter sp.]
MRHIIAAAVLLAAAPGFAVAADYDVHQRGNQFDVKKLAIHVGDSVTFHNDDAHFHNIFSLSEAQPFDLGSYPQGESRKVTFTKEGEVDVECAIHPAMKMTIVVAK